MHIPVLKKEVVSVLNLQENDNFIDCTVGSGGHAKEILEKIQPNGKCLGIDFDEKSIENLKEQNIKNLVLECDNFRDLEGIAKKNSFLDVSGILFDLGISSVELEESGRGFSFLKNEILDMRFNSKIQKISAKDIVNSYEKEELEKIIRDYGQERFYRKIAENIVKERKMKKIETTFDLVEIIKKSVRGRERIHFATRTFQALRIAVNDELNNLKEALPQALNILNGGGRIAVISFHSLEDRIVKNFFKDKDKEGKIKIITLKPIEASKEELKTNIRSRSAKLRAAEKI